MKYNCISGTQATWTKEKHLSTSTLKYTQLDHLEDKFIS